MRGGSEEEVWWLVPLPAVARYSGRVPFHSQLLCLDRAEELRAVLPATHPAAAALSVQQELHLFKDTLVGAGAVA